MSARIGASMRPPSAGRQLSSTSRPIPTTAYCSRLAAIFKRLQL
jgi:hypothetical protein